MSTLYEDLKAAGLETDHHESDLYFPRTNESLAILKKHPLQHNNATAFKHLDKNEIWFDVPFAYDPFWDRIAHRETSQD
jgi:hypothetical protein